MRMQHIHRGNVEGCPKLPGYTFEHHHVQEELAREPAFRRQTLVQEGDHMVVRALVPKTRQGRKRVDTQECVYDYFDGTKASYEPFVPSWIKYQDVVLCFHAICGGRKVEDASTMAVQIVYHMYDSTFEVLYGDGDLKGKVLIKRYTNMSDVDQPCVKGSFDPFKVQIGDSIEIFGRYFTIVDADDRTREFRGEHGCPIGAPMQSVEGLAEEETEGTRGQQPRGEKITSYLTCERKAKTIVPPDWKGIVLRFWATCEEEEEEEDGRFLIQYYPEDSSIELRQFVDFSQSKTCRYLSRTTLVDPIASMIQPGDTMVGGPLQLQDVLVGRRVTICGKRLFVYKTDKPSLQWINNNVPNLAEGICEEISIDHDAVAASRRSKHQKISCLQEEEDKDQSSPPPPPGVNEMQFLAQFSAEKSLKRISRIDKERKFVITVHCPDETISIREIHRPNSGTIAGKFLERQTAFHTYTDRSSPLKPHDFYIGVHIEIYGHWFEVLDADIATMRYIAMNPDYFTSTDGSEALSDVQNALASCTFAPSHPPAEKNSLDPIWNGHSALLQGLKKLLPQYSMQQLINACALLAHE